MRTFINVLLFVAVVGAVVVFYMGDGPLLPAVIIATIVVGIQYALFRRRQRRRSR